jgi:hypothetical protein
MPELPAMSTESSVHGVLSMSRAVDTTRPEQPSTEPPPAGWVPAPANQERVKYTGAESDGHEKRSLCLANN